MAVAQLHARNTQPNFSVEEDTVTVIGKAITARDYASKKDRARAALQQKDSIDKGRLLGNFADGRLLGNFADGQKANFAKQETIVTNIAFYNATGDPIKLVSSKNWNGKVQGSYPDKLENGHWAQFVHTQRPLVPEGSKAAVVYRIKNINEKDFDWMFAWDNPPKKQCSKTHAYTEIREVGHFTDKIWPIVNQKLIAAGQGSSDTQNGCIATVTITAVSPANYVAVISLDD